MTLLAAGHFVFMKKSTPRATDDISQRHFRKSVPLHRPFVYSSVLLWQAREYISEA